MRLSKVLAIVFCSLAIPGAVAQQAPPMPEGMPKLPFDFPAPTPGDHLVSPSVTQDGMVTFRVYAPKASSVTVKNEGLDAVPKSQPGDVMKIAIFGTPMTKGPDGVWTITVGPYPAGAYRYTYDVDGVDTVDPRNPATSESLNNVRSIFLVSGGKGDELDVPHGHVDVVYYHSDVTSTDRRMHVYTPPGYENGKKALPVLYLLHGGGDSDDSWTSAGRANFILDNLIHENAASPMIVVMPAGHLSRNSAVSPRTLGADAFDDDLVRDVIPYVEAHYRVSRSRNDRALAGLSMGGMQTLYTAIPHPELFAYVGLFSTGLFPNARADFETKYKAALDAPQKAGNKLLWVGAGEYDIALLNSRATVEILRAHGYTVEAHDTPGYHAWSTWRSYLSEFVPLLFKN